ncbi:MAG: hypothetical protein FWG98_09195 [Candidatus Cloacimonetes bacterium]|nr:hypothetical protein [Candidatus Cloacimonadota bacterium]
MNKEAMIYLVIFLLSLLITGSLLMYSYMKNSRSSDVVDTLLVEIPENIPYEQDISESQQEETRRTFVDQEEDDRRTFLNRQGETSQQGLRPHEQEYVSLVEQLRALFGGGMIEEEEEEEEEEEIIEEIEEEIELHPTREEILEVTISSMALHLESQRMLMSRYRRENERLREALLSRDDEIIALNYLMETLRETISGLQNEIIVLSTPVEIEEEIEIDITEPDYRQLARIFNNMDASRVAQILQTLPPETAINVLRAMNQRRIPLVMAALPPRVATQYSQLLLN